VIIFTKWRGAWLWSMAAIVASAGILLNNTIYFGSGQTPEFLLEKGAWAHEPWWLAAFYYHLVGASVSLAAGTPLMFSAWTRRYPAWHRQLGYVYVNAVLWMAAPSGLALALVAKGGTWGTAGFLLAGVLWWQTTWTGYRAIRRGDLPTHIRAMVRSFCWALSAPAFRLIQIALFAVGLDDSTNYIASLWLSIAASVWLAESFLYRSRRVVPAEAEARSPAAGALS
jgi:uncharacterized membrane protein